MLCVKPIFLCLFSSQPIPFLAGVGTLVSREEAADTLMEEMTSLEAIKTDTEEFIVLLETAPVKRTKQVEDWLKSVDSLGKQVHEFIKSFVTQETSGCFGDRSIWENYQAGRQAAIFLRQVRVLKDQKGFTNLVKKEEADQTKSELVPAFPTDSISVVGAEETLDTIRRLITSSDEVKIIGIYGMGGVGKTTLLTKIHGEMGAYFDAVIWVTVSREVNVYKIQEEIGTRLGFTRAQGETLPLEEAQRASFLSGVLSRKKALLLLDDLWEKLDLVRIGIPLPRAANSTCKVAFTTRSEEVCIAMQAQEKVKVMPLPANESWELFSSKIGDRVDLTDPSIEPLAKEVTAKCGGLPLTLVTVGRAMENATTVGEWKKAKKNLKDSPNEIQGMHNVLSLLKFSYDRLRSDSLRWCLLYCVSFPEDHEIFNSDIVNYWVGEGIFSGVSPEGNSRRILLNQAYEVIDELKAACLLEAIGRNRVKMHDGIHDMALWISSGDSENNSNVIFSYAGLGLTQWPIAERWGEAKLISLMYNSIEELPDNMPDCPKLTSLLVNDNPSLKKPIPESFFSSMPILRVLDLSYTGIEELPKSIGLLVQLQYLNLSTTNISSLPEEMGNLQKLRHLRLWKTFKLETVPRREILKLSTLQSLDLSYSKYIWDASDADGSDEISIKKSDLEAFDQLEDLGLTIATSDFFRVLLTSHSWSNAMKYLSLQVEDLSTDDLATASESMTRLLDLVISHARELEELILTNGQFRKLDTLKLLDLPDLARIVLNKEAQGRILPVITTLEIGRCKLLRDLTWVHELSTLTFLDLHNLNEPEELHLDNGEEEEEETGSLNGNLPHLKTLLLGWLRGLRSISRRPLLLPSLELISVYGCPRLRRLPFAPGSAKKIKTIKGSQRWLGRLVWEPETIKATFLPRFTVSKWADEAEERGIRSEDWEEEDAVPEGS